MKTQEVTIARPTVDNLRDKAAVLQKRLHSLALEAMTDPAKLDERMRVREELDAIPAMIGELRRREVLEHLPKMASEAAKLSAEVAEAQAAVDAYNAEYNALDKDIRKLPGSERIAAQKQLFDKTRQSVGANLVGNLMQKRARLDGLYSLAVRSYGVFLDGSERQLQHRDGLHPSLSYQAASSESAWESAASRIGFQAETDARRELTGNGSNGLRMRV